MSDVTPTMTVPELAARMGIDQSTAWRYLRDGKLPGLQIGSRWIIDRERVERYLAGKEDAAGNPVGTVVIDQVATATVLELVPRLTQTDTDAAQASAWLRGLIAALQLLASSIETTAAREAPQRLEA